MMNKYAKLHGDNPSGHLASAIELLEMADFVYSFPFQVSSLGGTFDQRIL